MIRVPLLDNGGQATWIDSRVATLGDTALKAVRGSSSTLSPKPSGEPRSLCHAVQLDEAVDGMFRMERQGNVQPVNVYLSLLKACGRRKALAQAKEVYLHLARHGLESSSLVGDCVVSTLVKCGGYEDAIQVFYRLPHRSVVSWTAVMSGYTASGQGHKALEMYKQMKEEGVQPDSYVFVTLLKACAGMVDLEEGKRIHAEALRYGCESDLFVRTCLVDMYAKCRSIADAENVFRSLSQRDVVSWNSMLAAYVQQGQAENALNLYKLMREEDVSPTNCTFLRAIQACGMLAEKEEPTVVDGRSVKQTCLLKGKALHASIYRHGYHSDVFVGSTLVSMYGKCGSVADAQCVFDSLWHRDVVAWNVIITAYVEGGQAEVALQLYGRMQEEAVTPNNRSFMSTLQACSMLAEKDKEVVLTGLSIKPQALQMGKAIHADLIMRGYNADVIVGSTLIGMYGKCGTISDAQGVFDGLPIPDVVAWTSILAVHVEQDQSEKALQLYSRMLQEGVTPDDIAFLWVIQAGGNMGSLGILRQIEITLVCSGNDLTPRLANTLITAYGRCASMVGAERVFDVLQEPDVVSWSALIAAYARQGHYMSTVQCYDNMRLAGVSPDRVTFLSLLSACSHMGLLERGIEYLESMTTHYCLTPGIEHYVCMVDLFGRAGCFSRIEELLLAMPVEPNIDMWLSLMGACRKHGKVLEAERVFDCALSLEPQNVAAYVSMSNIYADAGLWDQANSLRQRIGPWKKPGLSWIEHEQGVQTFSVGDCSHPQHEHLFDLIRNSCSKLKEDVQSHNYIFISLSGGA